MMGKVAVRPARVERADVVSPVAGALGVCDAASVLAQSADDGRLCAGRGPNLPDDSRHGPVLL